MKEFAVLRAKTCSYLTYNNDEDKKFKGTKKCAAKRKLKFEYYKRCLEATQLILMWIIFQKIIKYS